MVMKVTDKVLAALGLPNSFRGLVPFPTGNLSGAMKRHVWKMASPELYKLKLSANAAVRVMKAMGLGIRRSEALSIYKGAVHKVDNTRAIAGLPSTEPIPDDLIGASPRIIPTRYGYKVTADVYDENDNFLRKETKWMYSEQKYTKRGIASMWGKARKVAYPEKVGEHVRNVGLEEMIEEVEE